MINISDIGDPSYICSPQSTIIAAVIVVLLLNFGLVTGFIFFYRMKRKHWVKSKEAEGQVPRREDLPPPLPPHNTRHGAVYSQAGQQEVIFKSAYDNSRPRTSRWDLIT